MGFTFIRCASLPLWCPAAIGIVAALGCASRPPVRLPAPPVGQDSGQESGPVSADAYYEVNNRYCSFPRVASRAVVTASVLVRGTSDGQPVSGRVWVGVDYDNRSLRVESEAPAQFILTAERALSADGRMIDGFATLYLPRRRQIVQRESSRELLTAVLGLPLTAYEFVWAFSGCGHPSGGNLQASTLGSNTMRVSTSNTADLYLQRTDSRSPWALFATSGQSLGRAFRWRAEYARERDVMQSVRIVSEENGAKGRLFDLDFSLSHIQFAPLVVAETFSPTVPPGTPSVSLDMVQRQRSRRELPMVTAAP